MVMFNLTFSKLSLLFTPTGGFDLFVQMKCSIDLFIVCALVTDLSKLTCPNCPVPRGCAVVM